MTTWIDLSNRVAQASGMVSVQAGCTPDEAILLLEERARESGRGLDEIAEAVLKRTVRFG